MSVVGKYRYLMDSALKRGHLPVIVDIFLVGRTKIITLHSSIWASNVTDRPLSLRLHIPITSLAAPTGAGTGTNSTSADANVAPLLPGKGRIHLRSPPPLRVHSACKQTAIIMQVARLQALLKCNCDLFCCCNLKESCGLDIACCSPSIEAPDTLLPLQGHICH